MKIQIFKSTDTSAPVLTDSVGTLITLLNACLVDGVNSYTGVSWSRAGTLLTVTKANHGYLTADYITFSNSTDANIDSVADSSSSILGEKITVVDANTFTKTVTNSGATTGTWSSNFTANSQLTLYAVPTA